MGVGTRFVGQITDPPQPEYETFGTLQHRARYLVVQPTQPESDDISDLQAMFEVPPQFVIVQVQSVLQYIPHSNQNPLQEFVEFTLIPGARIIMDPETHQLWSGEWFVDVHTEEVAA